MKKKYTIKHSPLRSSEIAVIILNWNKKDDVLALLSQLKELIKPELDIFLVDNASNDGSVAAVKYYYPNVKIIINSRNLGGTGGFNKGMSYICKKNTYDYIWLLDNDARIKYDTLHELIKAIKSDKNIGLVGSRIVDIDKKSITVESGSNLRKDIIGVIPVNRNSIDIDTEDNFLDVDYVPICSALIKINTLQAVGLMDERFFVFWDDMEWGLRFKENGFRVICALNSVAYHGSFTERERGDFTNYYYGIRNSLLVYAKHSLFQRRWKIFYNSLRKISHNYCFFIFVKEKNKAVLIRKAIYDFLFDNWGKIDERFTLKFKQNNYTRTPKKSYLNNLNSLKAKTILISLMRESLSEGEILLSKAEGIFPESKISILIHEDRKNYFLKHDIFSVDRTKVNRLYYALKILTSLKRKNYALGIAMKPHPLLLYACKNVFLFNEKGEIVSKKKYGFKQIIFLFTQIIIGEIGAVILLPFILFKGKKYNKLNKLYN